MTPGGVIALTQIVCSPVALCGPHSPSAAGKAKFFTAFPSRIS